MINILIVIYQFKQKVSFFSLIYIPGMNIGNSAIYFALNGAKRVIGLESYPYAFSYAEKNIKLNNLNNIILLNAGYSKDSTILIDDKKYQ